MLFLFLFCNVAKCFVSDSGVDLAPMLAGNGTQLTADTEVNSLWIEDGLKSLDTRYVISGPTLPVLLTSVFLENTSKS